MSRFLPLVLLLMLFVPTLAQDEDYTDDEGYYDDSEDYTDDTADEYTDDEGYYDDSEDYTDDDADYDDSEDYTDEEYESTEVGSDYTIEDAGQLIMDTYRGDPNCNGGGSGEEYNDAAQEAIDSYDGNVPEVPPPTPVDD
jgi:hypothetical protein